MRARLGEVGAGSKNLGALDFENVRANKHRFSRTGLSD